MLSPGSPGALVRPVKLGATTTPGLPVTPGPTGTPVTPVNTGQKALEAQDTQFLDRSELIVQNSPVRPVQLERNVHASSDLLNSDSLDDRADESPEQAILRHSRHQSPAMGHLDTGHTGNTGTGHTGTGHTGSTGSTGHTGQHWSDREHSILRTHSVRSDAVDHRSTLLNRTLQQHRLELEYRSATDRNRHPSRSSRKDSGTHRAAISLRHVDPGELSPAEMLRHRRVRSSSRSYDSSLQDVIVAPPLVREGRKRSHIRRRSTLPLLVLLAAAHLSLLLEKDQSTGINLRRRRNTLAHALRSMTNM